MSAPRWVQHLPFDCRYSAGSPAWKAAMATQWNRVTVERARRLMAAEAELGERVALAADLGRLLNPDATRAADRQRRRRAALGSSPPPR